MDKSTSSMDSQGENAQVGHGKNPSLGGFAGTKAIAWKLHQEHMDLAQGSAGADLTGTIW